MMTSPWMNGGNGAEFTIPGYANLLMDQTRAQGELAAQSGQQLGGIASGLIGAAQAYQQPEVFGAGTSPARAALNGFDMNMAASGDLNGFARLTRGNNGGANTAPGGMNFKAFAALGKAADASRESLKAITPALPGQEPAIFGMTDDQWKHAGTEAKVAALQTFQQQQEQKKIMQAYDLGQVHLQQAQAQLAQQQQDQAALKQFGQRYQTATGARVNTGADQFSMFANMAGGKPTVPGQTLSGRDVQRLALSSGVRPQDALALAQSEQALARGERALSQEDRQNTPVAWTNPDTKRKYTLFGNTILPSKSDDELAAEAQARANAVGANQRLSSISQALRELYRTPNWQTKPDVKKRIDALEAAQEALLSGIGGAAADNAAPANKNINPDDPLGIL